MNTYVINTIIENIPASSKVVNKVRDMIEMSRIAIAYLVSIIFSKFSLNLSNCVSFPCCDFVSGCNFNLSSRGLVLSSFSIFFNDMFLKRLIEDRTMSPISMKKFLKISITCPT
jgi:hypothetical protein